MKLAVAFLVVSYCCLSALALYEDQAGLVDWHVQRIGRVNYAAFHASSSRRVVVGTERGVVATLNSRSGEIEWRYVFPKTDRIEKLVSHPTAHGVFVIANGGARVLYLTSEGWNKWSASAELKSRILDATFVSSRSSPNDVAVLSVDGVTLKAGASGKALWTTSLECSEGSSISSAMGGTEVHVLQALSSGGGKYLILDATSGKVKTSRDLSGFSTAAPSLVLFGGSGVAWVGSDRTSLSVAVGSAAPLTWTSKKPIEGLSFSQNVGGIVVVTTADGDSTVLQVTRTALSVIFSTPGHVAVTELEGSVYMGIATNTPTGPLVSVYNITAGPTVKPLSGGMFSFLDPVKTGPVARVWLEAVKPSAGASSNLVFRCLVLTADDSLSLSAVSDSISSEPSLGRLPSGIWVRDEALATIVRVQPLLLPEPDVPLVASHSLSNVVAAYVRRIALHAQEALGLLEKAVNFVSTTDYAALLSGSRTRTVMQASLEGDSFGFSQLLIALTASGRVYALHSLDGSVVWSVYLANYGLVGSEATMAFTSVAPPSLYELTVVAPHVNRLGTVVVKIDGLTGTVKKADTLQGFVFRRVLSLPSSTAAGTVHLIALNKGGEGRLLDEFAFPAGGVYYTEVDEDGAEVAGFLLRLTAASTPSLTSERLWSSLYRGCSDLVSVEASVKPLAAVVRAPSSGPPMYRQVSRNLMAILTEDSGETEEGPRPTLSGKFVGTSVSARIINTVTGAVVHHAFHARASGPITATFFDNTLVYQYWNIKSTRYELAVIDLYDSDGDVTHRHTTQYSAWTRPKPLAEMNTFIFPYQLSALGVTTTRHGVTHRGIVASYESSLVLLSRRLLDGHRPILAPGSPSSASENLDDPLPYAGMVVPNPLLVLSYNRSVAGIQEIFTAPCKIESNSLLFAYGLDSFCTRVLPSQAFDLLGDDFQFLTLGATIVALSSGAVLLHRMSKAKALAKAWK